MWFATWETVIIKSGGITGGERVEKARVLFEPFISIFQKKKKKKIELAVPTFTFLRYLFSFKQIATNI